MYDALQLSCPVIVYGKAEDATHGKHLTQGRVVRANADGHRQVKGCWVKDELGKVSVIWMF